MIPKIKCGVLRIAATLAWFLIATAAMAQIDSDRGGNSLWQEAQAAIDAREYEAAIPLLSDLADRGSLQAALLLGDIYGEGRLGGDADYDAARRWWRQAAMGGVAEAQYNLAVSYREGHGTPVNLEEAIQWYREAADRGDHASKYQLGQLLLAHNDASRHPEGYMYMKLAVIAGTDGMALATSLLGTSYRYDTALATLRAEAASGLWSRAHADPANPLNSVSIDHADPPAELEPPRISNDRNEGHSYVIDHFMRTLFGMQDRAGHHMADDRSARTSISFSKAIAVNAGLYAQIGRDTTGRAAILYPFYATGTKAEAETAAYLTRDQLWSIVRPGDMVLLSDQVNHHITYVYGVDRSADRLTFLDVWPDDFLLLEGNNVLGAGAELGVDGRTRRLLTVTGDEFRESIAGLGTAGNAEFPAVLMAAFPDLAGDWRVRLSLGTALLDTLACEYLDAAAAHLAIAYKLTTGVDAESRNAVADRALLAKVVVDACNAVGLSQGEAVDHLAKVPDSDAQSLTFAEIRVLCFLLLNLGRIEEARAIAQNRLRAEPEAPDGQLLLALIEIETGALNKAAARLSDAIDRLETLLGQFADLNQQAHVTRAERDLWADMLVLAYVDRGYIVADDDPERAYQDAERALALSPGHEDAIHLARDAGRLSGHLRRVSELHGQLQDRDMMSPLHDLYGLGN